MLKKISAWTTLYISVNLHQNLSSEKRSHQIFKNLVCFYTHEFSIFLTCDLSSQDESHMRFRPRITAKFMEAVITELHLYGITCQKMWSHRRSLILLNRLLTNIIKDMAASAFKKKRCSERRSNTAKLN